MGEMEKRKKGKSVWFSMTLPLGGYHGRGEKDRVEAAYDANGVRVRSFVRSFVASVFFLLHSSYFSFPLPTGRKGALITETDTNLSIPLFFNKFDREVERETLLKLLKGSSPSKTCMRCSRQQQRAKETSAKQQQQQ